MKKSLSVVLGSALAVAMLSTGAFATSSEDFADLGQKVTKEQLAAFLVRMLGKDGEAAAAGVPIRRCPLGRKATSRSPSSGSCWTTRQTLLAEDERVASLSFENTSGMIANSASTSLRVKAVNQYGEMTTLPADRFNAFVAGKAALDLHKDDEGYLVITTDVATNAAVQASGSLAVNVYTADNSLTLTQSFKVGDKPQLMTIRAHKISYSRDRWTLEKTGDTATITMLLFDQYGNPLNREQFVRGELLPGSINPRLVLNGQYVEIVKTGSDYTTDDFFDMDKALLNQPFLMR